MINQEGKKIILSADEGSWEEIRAQLPKGYLKQTANHHRREAGLRPFTLERNRNGFNHDFFSEPDLTNAYWAGLIAADGCIIKSLSGSQDRLAITLAKKDRVLLERFSSDIGSLVINAGVSNGKDNCTVQLYSNQIASDLSQVWNVIPQKTYTLNPPLDLTKEQALAFVAGYIDGDGCYKYTGSNNKRYPQIVILGTEQILSWIKSVLCPDMKPVAKKIAAAQVWSLSINGVNAILADRQIESVGLKYRLDRKRNYWMNNNVYIGYDLKNVVS